MESKKINQLATNLAPVNTDLTVIGDPLTGELKKITLLQIASIFGVGIGSIGMVVPSGFSVSPSTLTANGTFTISGAGTTAQYIRGDGSLATFPTLLSSDRLIQEVRNNSGATMLKGTIVYINGAVGNKATIAKALATSDATSAQTYGVVQDDIPNNSNGYVVVVGEVTGLDTSAVTEGQQLYLSGTIAGFYTVTKPYAPIHLVYVAIVLRSHPTLGVLGVKIQNGYEMDELHNVDAVSPSNNDGLFYNTTTSLWEHKPIATVLGYTPVTSARTISTTSPLSGGGDLSANRTLTIAQSTTSVDGYLSATDWNTFNGKQGTITLTTTGTSGAATFISNTLNIPQYSGTNLYNADGTLTGNRTLTSGGYNLTFTGSNTAATAIARGVLMNHTLVASANSDVLVGLDINPTFTLGAFTPVTQIGYRGQVASGTGKWNLYMSGSANNYMAGSLGIGNTNVTARGIIITKGDTGSTYAAGIEALIGFKNDVTSDAHGMTTYLGTDNTAFTLAKMYHYRAGGPATFGSTTVTNQYGFYCEGLSGATNNYAFYGNIASGTGRWNLYMNGTAKNYLAGNLLIGTTTDAGYKLDVNGTARVTLNQNAATTFVLTNSNSGASARSYMEIGSDASSGSGYLVKVSTNYTAYKTVAAKDFWIYNATGGNITLLNDFASGNINFTAGGASTAQMTLSSTGNIALTGSLTSTNTSSASSASLIVSNNLSTQGIFRSYGSTFGTGTYSEFSNIVGFGSTSSIKIFTDAALTSGGTNSIQFMAGGYNDDQERARIGTYGMLIGTKTSVASSILTLSSTTKGFLPPRMTTTQKNAIATPAAGLMVFDTTLVKLCVYSGTAWETITSV